MQSRCRLRGWKTAEICPSAHRLNATVVGDRRTGTQQDGVCRCHLAPASALEHAESISDGAIFAEQVLRDVSRARTFSVVRVLQTEALAHQTKQANGTSDNDEAETDAADHNNNNNEAGEAAADGGSAASGADHAATTVADAEGGNTPVTDKATPEKVIGINLPTKHVRPVLEAIRKLDGGIE